MAARSATLLVPLVALAVLAGCTQSKDKTATAPSTSSAPTSSSAKATPKPSATPTPKATAKPTLGGHCEDLLSVSTVDEALGRPVIGQTAFVLGIAEPNIGRLTYLNCRYGIPKAVKGKPAPTAQLEIGVSLYKSIAQAQTRVQGTIEDYKNNGAHSATIPVGDGNATFLTGYGLPTLVIASGPRTVAITISGSLLRIAPTATLQTLTRRVLIATSDFDGVAGVTATPSPTGTDDLSGSGSVSDSASPSTTSS